MFGIKRTLTKAFRGSKVIGSEKGFSLIELVVVVVILSILVGIAVAILRDASRNPANEAHNANVRTLISAMHTALSEHGSENFAIDNDNPIWHRGSPNPDNNNPCWEDYIAEWPNVPVDSDGHSQIVTDNSGPEYEVYLDSTTTAITVFPPMVD